MGKEKIGFIGLGTMGLVMTRRLVAAGYPLIVWNRTQDKAEPLLSEGAEWGDSPAAVASAASIVITMVSDAAASKAVLCGSGGVLEGASPGLIVIDSASIAPEASREHSAQSFYLIVVLLVVNDERKLSLSSPRN